MIIKSEKHQYEPIDETQVPSGMRWGTPGLLQGQHDQVEYGTRRRDGFGDGDPFKRVRLAGETVWRYYRRVAQP